MGRSSLTEPGFGSSGMTPREKNRVDRLKSQVDRLEGQVEALLQTVYDHARKIEELETKQRKLDGLRSNLS